MFYNQRKLASFQTRERGLRRLPQIEILFPSIAIKVSGRVRNCYFKLLTLRGKKPSACPERKWMDGQITQIEIEKLSCFVFQYLSCRFDGVPRSHLVITVAVL